MSVPVAVGEALGPRLVTVSEERVRAYAEASGDRNPIHTEPDFAASTPFGGTIAHGMLLLAYLSRLLSDRFGAAWPTTGELEARFRAPARVGTTVSVQGEVTALEDTVSGRRVRCQVRCTDEAGQTLVSASATLTIGYPIDVRV